MGGIDAAAGDTSEGGGGGESETSAPQFGQNRSGGSGSGVWQRGQFDMARV